MGDESALKNGRVLEAIYFIADTLGLTAGPALQRYGILLGTLGGLALAAFLFGSENLVGSIVALTLAFLAVAFVIVFWVVDEARKRNVALGRAQPLPRDALNPDFRDEAIAACVCLVLLILPLAMQSINDRVLHFNVAPRIACQQAQDPVCNEGGRALQLSSWAAYTLVQFLRTTPVAEFAGRVPPSWIGISPTSQTPMDLVDNTFRVVFLWFIGTIVIGLYNRVGSQIRDALMQLSLTSKVAASVGPIMIQSLADVVRKGSDGDARNALHALASIARRFDQSKVEIGNALEDTLASEVVQFFKPTASHELPRLKATAALLCHIGSGASVLSVCRRATHERETSETRCMLIDVLADTLKGDAARESLSAIVELEEARIAQGVERRKAALNKARKRLDKLAS